MREEASTEAGSAESADLSSQIVQTVQRQTADIVRCVRIHGDKYRCNWWSPADKAAYDNPAMRGGQLATTYLVRKSSFMRVTRSGEGLVIRELPS